MIRDSSLINLLKNVFFWQGWFDLASARHSMGTLRINSTLLDLKDHSAASTLQVTDQEGKVWLFG